MNFIFNHITNWITIFNTYAKDYPFVAGGLGVWFLSVLSYLARDIPGTIWGIIVKQSTTKITIMSTHKVYHNFLKWLDQNNYTNRIRSLKISQGKYGSSKEIVRSLGYGNHYFMYKFRPFRISMRQKETNAEMEKDEIELTILGRSYEFINHIHKEISDININDQFINISKYKDEFWNNIPNQTKRNLNTVYMKKGIKEKILKFLNDFKNNEKWYIKHGIPYQTGILLYGPPGNGKTSLIKAIGTELSKRLYILPTTEFDQIDEALTEIERNSIVVIEDIDRAMIMNKKKSNKDNTKSATEELVSLFTSNSFSDILNAIDGLISFHGRILIATTNHKEKLSDALLRDGRFDLKIEIGYVDYDILKQFFDNYYPKYKLPKNINIIDELSSAKLQGLILRNLDNPEKVLKEISL